MTATPDTHDAASATGTVPGVALGTAPGIALGTAPRPSEADLEKLAADTIAACSRLIRFDTSNFGAGESRGERACAEWVAEQITDAGFDPVVLESAPRRVRPTFAS